MNQDKRIRVGFAGVGLMGHGMAKHIVLKGFETTVWAHSNRKPVEDLVERGAKEAGSLKELAAASDVIVMCLTSSEVVDKAVFAADGLLASAAPGTVFIDTGTSAPDKSREVAERLHAARMRYADAPLSRSPARAEQGELVTMISCSDELLEHVRPVIEAYSEEVVHIGTEPGKAHEVKLLNNFIALSYVCTWSEAYNACMAAGIEPGKLHAVVSAAGMNCLNFQNYSKFVLDNDQAGHKFTVANSLKDINYYLDYARSQGVLVELAEPVARMFAQAAERGYGDDFAPVMPKVYGEVNDKPAGKLPRGSSG